MDLNPDKDVLAEQLMRLIFDAIGSEQRKPAPFKQETEQHIAVIEEMLRAAIGATPPPTLKERKDRFIEQSRAAVARRKS